MAATGHLSVCAVTENPAGIFDMASPVAHPEYILRINPLKQRTFSVNHNPACPVFAYSRRYDGAAELVGHNMRAIADTEHRHAKLKQRIVTVRGIGFVYAVRPARKDDPLITGCADFLNRRSIGSTSLYTPRSRTRRAIS